MNYKYKYKVEIYVEVKASDESAALDSIYDELEYQGFGDVKVGDILVTNIEETNDPEIVGE